MFMIIGVLGASCMILSIMNILLCEKRIKQFKLSDVHLTEDGMYILRSLRYASLSLSVFIFCFGLLVIRSTVPNFSYICILRIGFMAFTVTALITALLSHRKALIWIYYTLIALAFLILMLQ
ncbi:MAG: hypothetical protein LWX56_13500 [Ignavibacteria bacterium]|nr:hypothetical protein [Ignavibacteria bacterium]